MKGTVEIQQVRSPALAGNPLGDPAQRPLPVYLPPNYAASAERFPVVYFLHGFSGSGMAWLNSAGFGLNVPERLDELEAAASFNKPVSFPEVVGVVRRLCEEARA